MLVAMALWGWRCEGVWKRRRSPNPHQQQLCARQAQGRKECFTFMAVQCSGVTTEYFLRPQTKAATTQKIRGDASPFGFNGQMKLNEIAGVGNHNTALFWEYDTRTARRWNLDPVDQISISNYSVDKLNPIHFGDPLGDECCITAQQIQALKLQMQLNELQLGPVAPEAEGLTEVVLDVFTVGATILDLLGDVVMPYHPPATPPAAVRSAPAPATPYAQTKPAIQKAQSKPVQTPALTKRTPTAGDKAMPSQRAARREAFRRHGVPTSRPNNYKEDKDPSDKRFKQVKTKDGNNEDVNIKHHQDGHEFKDNGTYEDPHYHGTDGEHITYPKK